MTDEKYLLAAARYVELNPVRASLAADPASYPWSSTGAHLKGADDGLVAAEQLLKLVGDWRIFLTGGLPEEEYEELRRYERTGGRKRKNTSMVSLDYARGNLARARRDYLAALVTPDWVRGTIGEEGK